MIIRVKKCSETKFQNKEAVVILRVVLCMTTAVVSVFLSWD